MKRQKTPDVVEEPAVVDSEPSVVEQPQELVVNMEPNTELQLFEASIVLSGVGDAIGYKVRPFSRHLNFDMLVSHHLYVYRMALGSLREVALPSISKQRKNTVRFRHWSNAPRFY
jgi:hypothetical protein